MKSIISILVISLCCLLLLIQANSDNDHKLNQISSLKAGDIAKLRAINDNFREVSSDALNTLEVKHMFLNSVKRSQTVSFYNDIPKHRKLFIEILTPTGKLGLDILVPTIFPTQAIADVQFYLVDRIYEGESYTEENYGLWSSDLLWEFLVSADLVVES